MPKPWWISMISSFLFPENGKLLDTNVHSLRIDLAFYGGAGLRVELFRLEDNASSRCSTTALVIYHCQPLWHLLENKKNKIPPFPLSKKKKKLDA